MAKKVILVTGSTGNVGKELVPQLLDSGVNVRALTRDSVRRELIDRRADVRVCDLEKAETLSGIMDGVSGVYAITFGSVQLPNLIAAAKEAGVEHVVRQSTIEAGAVPPIGPGKWHREDEKSIEASGLAWTHLRPNMMMSNTIQWWARNIQKQNTVFFPGGKGRVSPVDPHDIAAVAKIVLTEPGHLGHAYDVTGPESLTIADMVNVLSKATGRSIRYVEVPESAAAEPMARMGLGPQVVAGLVESLGAIRSSKFGYVSDTVERLTGHHGRTFEMWARENINAFMAP